MLLCARTLQRPAASARVQRRPIRAAKALRPRTFTTVRAAVASPAPSSSSASSSSSPWSSWLADELANIALGASVKTPRCAVEVTSLVESNLVKSALRAEAIEAVFRFTAQHTKLGKHCTGTVRLTYKVDGRDMLEVDDVKVDPLPENTENYEELHRDVEFCLLNTLRTLLMDDLNQIMWDCEKRSMEEVSSYMESTLGTALPTSSQPKA